MMEIILVHGLAATTKSNWFPWFEKEIKSNLCISVKAVSLPNSKIPNKDKWVDTLHKEINRPTENTIIIAHSLGCIALLKYIEELPDNVVVGGIILISAFDKPLPLLPLINNFVDRKPNYQRIISKIKKVRVIGSTNDLIVPLIYTKEVANLLNTPLIEIVKAGHFTTQDGYKCFPELYRIFLDMIGI